jgi:hypothetical protein
MLINQQIIGSCGDQHLPLKMVVPADLNQFTSPGKPKPSRDYNNLARCPQTGQVIPACV